MSRKFMIEEGKVEYCDCVLPVCGLSRLYVVRGGGSEIEGMHQKCMFYTVMYVTFIGGILSNKI
jgi:hypothetical protein